METKYLIFQHFQFMSNNIALYLKQISCTMGKIKIFDTKKSIQNAAGKSAQMRSSLHIAGQEYHWSSKLERVDVIRAGIPYDSIEAVSKRLNNPVKTVLAIIGIPQTTYNKKKSEHLLLDSRDSELLILINELIDYGLEVFNNEEEKFQRWLKKPNLSIGGNSPETMIDTITGINEVKFSLNRLEFGNLA
jgi:putative toxin-antitoxin system antitoxin component (TIGR02293 family)